MKTKGRRSDRSQFGPFMIIGKAKEELRCVVQAGGDNETWFAN